MATEYQFIKLREKSADPTTQSKMQTTALLEAFNGKERVRFLRRHGDSVTIECAKTGRVVEVPWSGVAFARPMPAAEQPADAGKPPHAIGPVKAGGR